MDQFTRNSNQLKQNVNIIEALSSLCELAIQGDQLEEDIFYEFIEEKIMEEFLRLLKQTKDTNLINTILNQISMLMYLIFPKFLRTNIDKNIVVLLSLPQLNEFIIYNYDLTNEETQDYYINFIKILSNKVTRENINLFFNQKYAQFPLLLYSQNFFQAKDSLTRTHTRHILLKILQIVENSRMEKELLQYLQCYPFLQVLTNHISFMKELLFKWSKNQNYYYEELKNMYFFFKDIYQIAPYLIDILDNLFFYIIILPIYQSFELKEENIKLQNLLVLQIFFNIEVIFSKRLLTSILKLLFLHEIPKIQPIQLELNYLPTGETDLVNQCTRFFKINQNERQNKEKFGLLLYSISQTLSNVSNNSLYFKEIPKQEIYEDFKSLEYIQKLDANILFKENIIIYDEYQNNYIDEVHYYQILTVLQILMNNQTQSLLTLLQKQLFILDQLNIMLDEKNNKLNTLKNCLKITSIVNQLLAVQDQNFFIAFIRLILLRLMEQHIQSQTVEYYRYFSYILKLQSQKNYELFYKIPETHQIIRFFLILDLCFQRNWLKNTFSKTFNPISYQELQFSNGLIKLNNLEIITENLNFNLDEWKVLYEYQEEQTLVFINLINDEKLELVFSNKEEAEIFKSEVYQRQQDSEQYAIQQIILQLQQLYF